MNDFLIIAHSKRGDIVPHWLHQATLSALDMPCPNAHIYESHIFDIGESRQSLTEMFMNIPEATEILYVDDDITIPDRKSLVKMHGFLESKNESIVSGLYWEKSQATIICKECGSWKHRPLILAMAEQNGQILFGFPFQDKPIPENSVIKVGAVPAGFLLVKREVFEKIPPPWFVYGDPELTKKQAIKTGQPFGEDVYFSRKARQAGFNLWVDTRAKLLHYVPNFIGDSESLEFVRTGMTHITEDVQAMRQEYLKQLKERENHKEK